MTFSILKNVRQKLVFKIPFWIISVVVAIILLICVFLSIYLTSSKQKTVVSDINTLADNNAYMASSYLNNMQTLSQYLSLEISRFEALNDDTRSVLIRKTLESFLDDKRIYSAYVALEPNSLFQNTPSGISYSAYRDGNAAKLEVRNDYTDYKEKDTYKTVQKSLNAYITEPYSQKLSSGKTVWLITISAPILNGNGEFIGIVNTDVAVDTISGLSYNLGNYKTASNSILTDQHHYVTDTSKKHQIGSEAGPQDTAVYTASSPLVVNGIATKWASTFTVQKSEVLNDVYLAVGLICIFGLIGILLSGFVIITVLRKAFSPIKDVMQLSDDMYHGKLDSEIVVKTNDELGVLAQTFKKTAKELNGYIREISDVLGQLSGGDLRADVVHEYVGDFAPIRVALNSIIDSLNSAFWEIETAARQVSSGASEISSGAQILSQGATEQASSLEELSSYVLKVTDRVQKSAENANLASSLAQNTQNELMTGNETVQEMTAAMNKIHSSSTEITKIIKTINDIAFQTNILALNAAVEAARAGSAGKGFAVVADEVRNLAGKSAQAAKQTTKLIEESVNAVQDGMKIENKTAELLNSIIQKSTDVYHLVSDIAVATNDQANAIEQIQTNITQVSAVVQTNSATAEESAAAAEELSSQADLLRQRISMFQLKQIDSCPDTISLS